MIGDDEVSKSCDGVAPFYYAKSTIEKNKECLGSESCTTRTRNKTLRENDSIKLYEVLFLPLFVQRGISN